MDNLKSCPFCGSKALLWQTKHKQYPYRVKCSNDNCACETTRWKDYRMAIQAWNRREEELFIGEQDG